ncbi:ubiquitin-like domain-containing protein [Acutalibacter intestini]|uniref:ubiquitin-like domain-containing protein n=1 Tax=Acutalibacter intestini TaxID=3093659 RepID=UPI002AC938EB|nr:ubiquitin-like domain-containing protein [Acutalibacter sp. M00204]
MRKTYKKPMQRARRARLMILGAAGAFITIVCLAVGIWFHVATAPVEVVDGSRIYSFRTTSLKLEDVLRGARARGMAPLGDMDQARSEGDGTKVVVRRGVEIHVNDGGDTVRLVAYLGGTVEEALAENGIVLGKEDQVTPNREMTVAAALTVNIKRRCQVTVTADGKSARLTLTGATVAQALEEAGVKLGERDSCNYPLDSLLTDGMEIQVMRVVNLRITSGGVTKDYQVSAENVEQALEKCGFQLEEEDRLNVSRKAKLVDGMKIVLRQVRVKEEVETQDIDFETEYMQTSTLVIGESKTLTAGLKGKKEITYRSVYVGETLESREMVSEEVVLEPVNAVVMKGTSLAVEKLPQMEYIGDKPSSSEEDSAPSSGTVQVNGNGTLTGPRGEEIRYTKAMRGTCTAYCIPGGTTSVGLEAVRGVIAVDPEIIPYGTRMYVASPDGSIVYGYGVAGDTGGACLAGDIIADLCYDTIEECSIIGRREMVLYILD